MKIMYRRKLKEESFNQLFLKVIKSLHHFMRPLPGNGSTLPVGMGTYPKLK